MTRWCSGPCGRELALEAFRVSVSHGKPFRRRICKACQRVRDRAPHARWYRRAAKAPEFLAREAARKRAAYNLGRTEGRGLVGAHWPQRQVTRIADTAKASAPSVVLGLGLAERDRREGGHVLRRQA